MGYFLTNDKKNKMFNRRRKEKNIVLKIFFV